jgi:integrase
VHPSKVERHDVHIRIAVPPRSALRTALHAALTFPVASPFLLARKPLRRRQGATKTHWSQWTRGYLTRRFAAARDAAGIGKDALPESRPTLYELRSLGARLYRDAGYPEEYVQALLGHRTAAMTEHYLRDGEVQWTEAEAGL